MSAETTFNEAPAQPHADKPTAGAGTARPRVLTDPAGHTLQAATDHFAQRPLCWRAGAAEGLRVAPRADTLLAGPAAALDPQALLEYLFFHAIPAPRTVFRGVQRLRAGRQVQWNGHQASVAPWWRPSTPAAQGADFAALRQRFLDLLESAVQRALGPGEPTCSS